MPYAAGAAALACHGACGAVTAAEVVARAAMGGATLYWCAGETAAGDGESGCCGGAAKGWAGEAVNDWGGGLAVY